VKEAITHVGVVDVSQVELFPHTAGGELFATIQELVPETIEITGREFFIGQILE